MLISAVELAGLQLPKLPNSRQGIEYHAKKNNWQFEEVVGQARGGKLKKYLVSALPSEIQAAIQEKQAATLLAKVPMLPAEVKKPLRQNKKMRQLGLIPCEEGLARLDDRQTETAHARCAIVAHVLSETAVAVADALRHGMTHFPPPLGYYSDNGSGETGDMLDKETTGILPRIGIEHFTGIPGNPQGRGKIERLWQTITIPLAKQ